MNFCNVLLRTDKKIINKNKNNKYIKIYKQKI